MSIVPASGRTAPRHMSSVVVFPAPLGPSRATRSPTADGEVDAVDRPAPPVILDQPVRPQRDVALCVATSARGDILPGRKCGPATGLRTSPVPRPDLIGYARPCRWCESGPWTYPNVLPNPYRTVSQIQTEWVGTTPFGGGLRTVAASDPYGVERHHEGSVDLYALWTLCTLDLKGLHVSDQQQPAGQTPDPAEPATPATPPQPATPAAARDAGAARHARPAGHPRRCARSRGRWRCRRWCGRRRCRGRELR